MKDLGPRIRTLGGQGLWCVGLLGGSWAVISGVISPLIWAISMVALLITTLITTHEPPSRAYPEKASKWNFGKRVGVGRCRDSDLRFMTCFILRNPQTRPTLSMPIPVNLPEPTRNYRFVGSL